MSSTPRRFQDFGAAPILLLPMGRIIRQSGRGSESHLCRSFCVRGLVVECFVAIEAIRVRFPAEIMQRCWSLRTWEHTDLVLPHMLGLCSGPGIEPGLARPHVCASPVGTTS